MGERRRLGVLGRPILHSRSPELFRAAFTDESSTYLRLSAPSARRAIALARTLELDGFNVTAPFKVAMAARVEACDEVVRHVGAVNTVVCSGGRLLGYNTDATGAMAALADHGIDVTQRQIVVFGSGGAGRAAAFGAARAGAQRVTLVSRAADQARHAAGLVGVDGCALAEAPAVVADADVLISCVPPDGRVIDRSWLRRGLAVMDANYGTSELAADGRAAGCLMVPGDGWLLQQAASAHERFIGRPAPLDAMRRRLGDAAPRSSVAKPNIALVGMMGVGKSTIGPELAQRLQMPFSDTDDECERQAHKSIGDIFEDDGEPAFRTLEREVIAEIGRTKGTVFACGGGALLDETSRLTVEEHCLVIWLCAPLEVSMARASRARRPLLSGATATEPLEELVRRRRRSYRRAAALVIDVGSDSPIVIADELAAEIDRAPRP